MSFKKIFAQLNLLAQCKKYDLPLRECPQFLFLIMGIVIIATALITYSLGTHYVTDPSLVSLIVLVLAVVLFIVSFSIIRGLEKLAEANRMKSEFVNIVSHQLKTPLSNLKWTVEFLTSGRSGEIKGKQAEYFRILKENSNRMGELVSDLLTISRIESGKLPLHKVEFSFEELTKEVISGVKLLARSSNVEIKFEAPKSLPSILADPSRIKVVIENLLTNAINYTKNRGGVKIKLGLEEKNLLFEIKDSGVGIPEKDQKHIFQKFFRSRNVLYHQTQGSGLGLYITKSIIEKSGGKIWFKSKEGEGTTFYFTLPIK